jgi:hypothetical protein
LIQDVSKAEKAIAARIEIRRNQEIRSTPEWHVELRKPKVKKDMGKTDLSGVGPNQAGLLHPQVVRLVRERAKYA